MKSTQSSLGYNNDNPSLVLYCKVHPQCLPVPTFLSCDRIIEVGSAILRIPPSKVASILRNIPPFVGADLPFLYISTPCVLFLKKQVKLPLEIAIAHRQDPSRHNRARSPRLHDRLS